MEHRHSVRKPARMTAFVYKNGVPVQSCKVRDIAFGGIFIDSGDHSWRKNEFLVIELAGPNGEPGARFPAVVAHQSPRGVGLMFDALSNQQKRVVRSWLCAAADDQRQLPGRLGATSLEVA
jgi:hypothetical protein